MIEVTTKHNNVRNLAGHQIIGGRITLKTLVDERFDVVTSGHLVTTSTVIQVHIDH